jgi:hypothetical protein
MTGSYRAVNGVGDVAGNRWWDTQETDPSTTLRGPSYVQSGALWLKGEKLVARLLLEGKIKDGQRSRSGTTGSQGS